MSWGRAKAGGRERKREGKGGRGGEKGKEKEKNFLGFQRLEINRDNFLMGGGEEQ